MNVHSLHAVLMSLATAHRPLDRRSQILDAAEQCFARAGFHRTTMQDVAGEAGMVPGNLYRYFPSKDALILALIERDRAEIAADFADGSFTARQINGKALSLEMTQHIKPAEKKVAPKSYTAEEEALIRQLVGNGAHLEDIAAKLNKPVNSVRGKLLSMELKAPQRDKKATKTDPYEGIEEMADKTVAEIAAHFGKTERGVRTVLTRRKMACADYQPKAE